MGERTYTLCEFEEEPGVWVRGVVVYRQQRPDGWYGHIEASRAPGMTRLRIVYEAQIRVMDPQPTNTDWLYEGSEVDEATGMPVAWLNRTLPWSAGPQLTRPSGVSWPARVCQRVSERLDACVLAAVVATAQNLQVCGRARVAADLLVRPVLRRRWLTLVLAAPMVATVVRSAR